jgi:hypothetical protein
MKPPIDEAEKILAGQQLHARVTVKTFELTCIRHDFPKYWLPSQTKTPFEYFKTLKKRKRT